MLGIWFCPQSVHFSLNLIGVCFHTKRAFTLAGARTSRAIVSFMRNSSISKSLYSLLIQMPVGSPGLIPPFPFMMISPLGSLYRSERQPLPAALSSFNSSGSTPFCLSLTISPGVRFLAWARHSSNCPSSGTRNSEPRHAARTARSVHDVGKQMPQLRCRVDRLLRYLLGQFIYISPIEVTNPPR